MHIPDTKTRNTEKGKGKGKKTWNSQEISKVEVGYWVQRSAEARMEFVGTDFEVGRYVIGDGVVDTAEPPLDCCKEEFSILFSRSCLTKEEMMVVLCYRLPGTIAHCGWKNVKHNWKKLIILFLSDLSQFHWSFE